MFVSRRRRGKRTIEGGGLLSRLGGGEASRSIVKNVIDTGSGAGYISARRRVSNDDSDARGR